MHLEFKRLSDINISDIIAVNTNSLVLRHMPLSGDNPEESDWMEWVEGKEKQWEEYGYGPWAFIIDDKFAGWGGLQYENGDADLGLVLHPDFWGTGIIIYEEIIKRAFGEMGFESITILLPPTRTRVKGILRLGFQLDGEVEINGEKFIRYRLFAPNEVLS
ncbi:MAG: GNAT family N-acetyltransferase [Anaerolineaceae bacterium]|nr:GNAT family N-acetyltransferase [Anaerolineaceae bacterium]